MIASKSEHIGQLAAALAAAQATFGHAEKDAKNPHFRSTYATLASVIDAVRLPLADHGIAIIQSTAFQRSQVEASKDGQRFSVEGAIVTVETILAHESGEYLAGQLSAAVPSTAPQAIGSAVSYLRRYALQAMVCLAASDDDGEAAQVRTVAPPRPPAPPTRSADWEADRPGFCAKLRDLGLEYDELAAWLESKGWPRPSHLAADRRLRLLEGLAPGGQLREQYQADRIPSTPPTEV